MKPIFEPRFDLNETKDNNFHVQVEANLENMLSVFYSMMEDAEKQWYVDRMVEILNTKGYTVTKNEDTDLD